MKAVVIRRHSGTSFREDIVVAGELSNVINVVILKSGEGLNLILIIHVVLTFLVKDYV